MKTVKTVKTVLVVEDDLFIREALQEALEDFGYHVFVAGNADDAVAILQSREDIELVFTDIEMPGSMNGMKLAVVVRNRWPLIHIIVASGKRRPKAMLNEALFISKPYLSFMVVAAIQSFAW